MQINNQIIFFDKATQSDSKEINILKSDLLQLEVVVEGSGSFKITTYGNIEVSDNYNKIAIISDKDYKILSEIDNAGLYKIDLTGLRNIKLELINNSNVIVTCKGNEEIY